MIRINLIGSREKERSSSRRVEGILAGGVLAIVLAGIALLYLSQQSTISGLDATTTALEGELIKIRQQNQELKKMEEQKRETEEKLRIVSMLTSKERRSAPVHILDDLSSSAPEYLWLTDFTEKSGIARINGKAVDNQTIASFANDLARSFYFEKVEIRETAQEDATTTPRSSSRAQPSGPQPQIALKRFLIESRINYLPGASQQSPTAAAPEGKSPEKRKKDSE